MIDTVVGEGECRSALLIETAPFTFGIEHLQQSVVQQPRYKSSIPSLCLDSTSKAYVMTALSPEIDPMSRVCPVCLSEFLTGWSGDRGLCSRRCYYETRKVPVLNIWLRDEGVCHLCRQFVALEDASRDHLRPRSMGGKTTYRNIALAHKRCNSNRGSIPVEDARKVHNVG